MNVSQDIRHRVTSCFVAIDKNSCTAGYYTLSAASISLKSLPEQTKKKLPKYDSVPAVRLGRLAVDKKHQGKMLGRSLLINALKRSLKAEIASAIFFVDAKNEKTKLFCKDFGFIPLVDKNLSLFLPLASLGNR